MFQRGAYGEILPIWLAPNASSQPSIGVMAGGGTDPIVRSDQQNTLSERIIFSDYQKNLSQVLLGRKTEDPADFALYRAVAQGERVSLRPVAVNGSELKTFVPALARIGDEQWQLGIVGEGRYAIVIGSIDEVLWQVWGYFLEWEKAEMIEGE